jgi:LacI family transcriptional regulator
VLIAATRGANGRELAFSVASKVDGLVVMARSLPDADVTALANSVPVVLLASRPAGADSHDRVGVDNRGGAHAIAHHLIREHGCRDIVFLAGPALSPDSLERFAGYRAALRAAGMPAPRRPHLSGGFTESGGARAVSELLAERAAPDAIVCGNDEMAIGALSVLKAAKIKVPGEVAVTGFDDIAATRHVAPPVTTVRQPMQQLGEQAVHAVLARVRDRSAARREVVLPTELVIRRSCGCRAKTRREWVAA